MRSVDHPSSRTQVDRDKSLHFNGLEVVLRNREHGDAQHHAAVIDDLEKQIINARST